MPFESQDVPREIQGFKPVDSAELDQSGFVKPQHEFAPGDYFWSTLPNEIVGPILDRGYIAGETTRLLLENEVFHRLYGDGVIPPEFPQQRPHILFDKMSTRPGLKRTELFKDRPQGNTVGMRSIRFTPELAAIYEAENIFAQEILNPEQLEKMLSRLSSIFLKIDEAISDKGDFTRLGSIYAMLEACYVYLQNIELYRMVKNPNAMVMRWGDLTEHPSAQIPVSLDRYANFGHENSDYVRSHIRDGETLVTYWFTFDHDGSFFAEQPSSLGVKRIRLLTKIRELESVGLIAKDTIEPGSIISIRSPESDTTKKTNLSKL